MRFSVQTLLTESKLHEVLHFEAVICVQSRRGRFWSGQEKCSQLNPITCKALCNQRTCALIKLRGWKEKNLLSVSNRKDVNKIAAENVKQKGGWEWGATQKGTSISALKTSQSWREKYLGHWMWWIKNYPIGTKTHFLKSSEICWISAGVRCTYFTPLDSLQKY